MNARRRYRGAKVSESTCTRRTRPPTPSHGGSHRRSRAAAYYKTCSFLLSMVRYMLLSCPAKKVTKECGIGEALSSALPRRKPPSPMYLSRRALFNLWRTLTGKACFLVAALLQADCSTTSALPTLLSIALRTKSRDTFCPNRIEVKVLRKLRKCAPGVSKGAALIAGAINSAPLGRLLLVLFLAKQEKYIPPHPPLTKQ